MCHGKIKLFLGAWLVMSGFIAAFQNPINMMVIGFIIGICCFRSYRFWQATGTGIIGLWLFSSGLIDLWYAGQSMVIPVNFIISGLLIAILGTLCQIIHSHERLTEESSFGAGYF